MKRNRQQAFTLIELLVVIAIIAVLIGILLPALSAAKATAVKVHCSAQIRNISLGLEMFANDFREAYPLAAGRLAWDQYSTTADGYAPTGQPSWMQQMYRYVDNNEEVLSGCHAYPVDTPYHYFLGTRAAFAEWEEKTGTGQRDRVVRTKMRFPSAHVLGGDNNIDFGEGNGSVDADKDDYSFECLVFVNKGETYDGPNARAWIPQHNNSLNVMFGDGHVASISEFDEDKMTYRYDRMSAY